MGSLKSGTFGIWWGIVRIYGPCVIYLIIQINSKSPLME
jgi:hypothetical protein